MQPIDERRALAPCPDLLARLLAGAPPPGPGSWQQVEPPQRIAGLPAGDVLLVHVRDAIWQPGTGRLLRASDGRPFAAPAAEVPPRAPRPPAGPLPRRGRAALWLPGGALGNYGHFLFDALPARLWIETAGLAVPFPPSAPPLARWQHDLLARAGLAAPHRAETAPAVTLAEAVYLTALDHYLQRGAGLIAAAAARLSAGAGAPGPGAVYLSRRGHAGRLLVNEAALEARLRSLGVRVIRPERLSVAEQAAAMAGTGVLIGASGAGLANLLFLPRGARVVEIRPEPVREAWITLACANLGLGHHVVPAAAPLPAHEVPLAAKLRQLPRRLAGRYRWAARVEIAAVEAALAAARATLPPEPRTPR